MFVQSTDRGTTRGLGYKSNLAKTTGLCSKNRPTCPLASY